MSDLMLTLSVDGDAGALPAPVARGDTKVLRILATDGPGGAAMAVTGVSLVLARPDGTQDTLTVGDGITAGATGVWTADVPFDAIGAWRAVARATAPQATTSADVALTVQGSAFDLPVPVPVGASGSIAATDITDATPTGIALLTAATASTARAVLAIYAKPMALQAGVDPTGEGDSTAGIAAALAQGGDWEFGPGTYRFAYAGPDAGGITQAMTKDLRVFCHPEAHFVFECDNDGIRLTAPAGGEGLPDGGVALEWFGGFHDQIAQPNSTSMPFNNPAVSPYFAPTNPGASSTAEALSFRGSYSVAGQVKNGFRRVLVEGARFKAGDHWQTAGGDSAIYAGEGTDFCLIRGCEFQGSRDVAIYDSRDSTGVAGGVVRIEDCRFVSCFYGAAVKRRLNAFVMSGNHCENCVIGLMTQTVVGHSDNGAITGNTFAGCSYNVRADYSTGVLIEGNRTVSLGATLADGTTKVAPYAGGIPALVLLRGTTECTVRDERCDVLTAAYVGGGAVGVWVEDFTDDGGSIASTKNLIENVHTTDFTRCVEEKSGSASNLNRVVLCYNWGTAGVRDPIIVGAASVVERLNAATMKRVFHTGVLVGDGSAASPILARTNQATGLFFGTNKAAVSVAGVERLSVESTRIAAALPVSLPSYTTAQKNLLTPSAGWVIFDSTLVKAQVYTGSAWADLH